MIIPYERTRKLNIMKLENVASNDNAPRQPELFPWKLHSLLEDAEDMGFDSIVSWLPGGTRFKVHDTEIFESLLTPRYFNQNYYKSFQRQLNIYGFERVRQGRHKGAYFHDLFVRGEPGLCHQMVRTKVRGRTSCKRKNSERPSR